MSRKSEQRDLVRSRLEAAMQKVYHNASVNYPQLYSHDQEREFNDWFDDFRSNDIDWLNSYLVNTGGGHKHSFLRNGKQRASHLIYYIDPMRSINDFGTIYQWGRGGRTLAPEGWIVEHGGSRFSVLENFGQSFHYEAMVELLLCVEEFNDFVAKWCNDVAEQWKQYKKDMEEEAELEAENAG